MSTSYFCCGYPCSAVDVVSTSSERVLFFLRVCVFFLPSFKVKVALPAALYKALSGLLELQVCVCVCVRLGLLIISFQTCYVCMCVCVCVLRDEAVIDTTLKASFRLRQRLHYSSSSATLFSCRHLCVLSLLQMSLLTLCACIQFLVGWSFVTKLCSACTRSVCIRV